MVFQASDKVTSPSTQSHSDASSSLMASVDFQPISKSETRPSDPHYVAQTEYDAGKGLKDLNSGKFSQGEDDLNRSLNDLKKEGKLISGAQSGGKSAAEHILSGNEKSAEESLTNSIKGMKGNGFTSDARKDYESALKQLDDGHKWAAEKDIASGEEVLGNRQNRVNESSKDIKTGLNDFNSGKFDQGEKDVRNGMKALDLDKVGTVGSGGHGKTAEPLSTSTSDIHSGALEIPNPAHLYT